MTMSPRLKSALLLLGTLGLGMLLGALLNGAVVQHRLARVEALRTERGLLRAVERTIEPRDDEQREAVRQVLRDAAPRYAEVMRGAHQELQLLNDALEAELAPLLTTEQQERLSQRLRLGPRGLRPERRGGRGWDRRRSGDRHERRGPPHERRGEEEASPRR